MLDQRGVTLFDALQAFFQEHEYCGETRGDEAGGRRLIGEEGGGYRVDLKARWGRMSDRKVLEAARNLADYAVEAPEAIRAEIHDRA